MKILRVLGALLLIMLLCVGLTQLFPAGGGLEPSTVELFDEAVPMVPVPPRVRIVSRDLGADAAPIVELPEEAVPLAAEPSHSNVRLLVPLAVLTLAVIAVLLLLRRRRRA